MKLKKIVLFFLFAFPCFLYAASTVNKNNSTVNRSNSTVNKSNSTINRNNSAVNKNNSSVNNSYSTINRNYSSVKNSNGNSIGVYEASVEKNTVDIYESNKVDVHQDIFEDTYVNGYGKWIKTVTSKDPSARFKFAQYFSDWQWSGQEQDFYSYSADRAEREKQLELCYDKALKKFGVGTAIIATTWVVSFVVPGGQVLHLSLVFIAKTVTTEAVVGGAIGGVFSCASALYQGKTGDELIYETVNGAADGYMIGAITGVFSGTFKAVKLAKNSMKVGDGLLVFNKKVYDASGKLVANLSKCSDEAVRFAAELASELGDDFAKPLLENISNFADDAVRAFNAAVSNCKDIKAAISALKYIQDSRIFTEGIKNGLGLDDIIRWNSEILNRVNNALGRYSVDEIIKDGLQTSACLSERAKQMLINNGLRESLLENAVITKDNRILLSLKHGAPTTENLVKLGVSLKKGLLKSGDFILEFVAPDFVQEFTTKLPIELFSKGDAAIMKECTKRLKEEILRNPKLKKKFTEQQLTAIMEEQARIPGLTWHHNPFNPGQMDLVDAAVHGKIKHLGGDAIWAKGVR